MRARLAPASPLYRTTSLSYSPLRPCANNPLARKSENWRAVRCINQKACSAGGSLAKGLCCTELQSPEIGRCIDRKPLQEGRNADLTREPNFRPTYKKGHRQPEIWCRPWAKAHKLVVLNCLTNVRHFNNSCFRGIP